MDRNFYYSDMDADWVRVALRKESVDRNNGRLASIHNAEMSLSARRAWIEIQVFQRIAKPFRVALRKESVDRNPSFQLNLQRLSSRSPQGERG